MLSITLVCVGKMRETYYISAFAEYAKRLGAYCRFDLVELPEQRLPERPSQKEIHAALEKEAQAIRARIPKGAAVIAMCVEGKLLSSEALARQLAGYAAGGTSKVCFLVGGSFGLDEGLKRDPFNWSLYGVDDNYLVGKWSTAQSNVGLRFVGRVHCQAVEVLRKAGLRGS